MKSEEVHDLSPTILLVDDELVVLKGLSRELIAEDYSVTAVSSGSAAISALQDTFYDLVITDLTMEGVGGLDVVRATRNIAPQTLIIVMTGYKDSISAKEAMGIGVDDFLVKPFEIEILLSSILLCLNKRNLKQI